MAIRIEYGYLIWMLENADKNNSEYRHFLRSNSLNFDIRSQFPPITDRLDKKTFPLVNWE